METRRVITTFMFALALVAATLSAGVRAEEGDAAPPDSAPAAVDPADSGAAQPDVGAPAEDNGDAASPAIDPDQNMSPASPTDESSGSEDRN
ncbi:MAG: hypothetical protein GC151_11965 [Betaproteobacteria bacterium]|nr:hypothetical protein [Betaproteobacteria bacterium]